MTLSVQGIQNANVEKWVKENSKIMSGMIQQLFNYYFKDEEIKPKFCTNDFKVLKTVHTIKENTIIILQIIFTTGKSMYKYSFNYEDFTEGHSLIDVYSFELIEDIKKQEVLQEWEKGRESEKKE